MNRAFTRTEAFAWIAAALALVLLPFLFPGRYALNLAIQTGIAAVLALSWNLLWGLTGLLSFGHAVFAGLGAYAAIHTLTAAGDGRLPVPLTLIPLAGGLAGALAGLVFGWIMTRRSPLVFAMVSMALGELAHQAVLAFTGVFGGEAGVSADRTRAPAPLAAALGIDFAGVAPLYALAMLWCLACALAMRLFLVTPLALLARAVRDEPERVAAGGHDPREIRWRVTVLSAFFAGIAGGVAALHQEIVGAESVSWLRSGEILIAAIIGGSARFAGPVLGALLVTGAGSIMANHTGHWARWMGLAFVAVVLALPGGLAALLPRGRA